MWVDCYKPQEKSINWNQYFLNTLKGDLDEDIAQRSLGKFLTYNISILCKMLTGKELAPFQRIILKGWFKRNFILMAAGRGTSKSTMAYFFAILYCVMHPDHTVLIMGPTFRGSRKILEEIEKISESPGGILLKQTLAKSMVKRQDVMRIEFSNKSQIVALPLGNAETIRGMRTNVLIIDEANSVPQNIIDFVLKPFLTKPADLDKQRKIRRVEDKLIKAGKMKEEEREVFKPISKMIMLSSAGYQWESYYKTYKDYLELLYNIRDGIKEVKSDDATYLVQQLSYEMIPEGFLDKAILSDIKNGLIPQSILDREYRAIFTQGSDGYFSAKKMAEVTIADGQEPCVELVGEKNAEYVLGIDPALSASESGDNFAMCLLKIITKTNGKKVGMVVHNYAACGCALKYHILYFLYLLRHFNIVYIIEDASHGSNMDFINICNESEIFKNEKIELKPIGADFGKDEVDSIAKQVKRFYNPASRQIVQPQYFHSSFIRASNEHLQSCFNFAGVFFAGKARAVPSVNEYMASLTLGNIHQIHPEFADKEGEGSIHDFIANQDILMDSLKRECSLIEIKASALGTISYDLPSNMRRTKSPLRQRRDSYSALLLANWGLKLFLMSQEITDEDEEEGVPVMMGFPQRH